MNGLLTAAVACGYQSEVGGKLLLVVEPFHVTDLSQDTHGGNESDSGDCPEQIVPAPVSFRLHTNYVSRQYLDNTENKDRSLPSYSTTNVNLSYTLPLKKIGVKEAVFGVNLTNIFDAHYASSGWAYSAVAESYGHKNENRYYQLGFIPMAGFTAMGSITLRF